jgi:hypothetical protein
MLLMMAGNVALIYVPGLPLWSGLLIAFAARNSAIYFTKWYPAYRKAKYGKPPAGTLPGTHWADRSDRNPTPAKQHDEKRIR